MPLVIGDGHISGRYRQYLCHPHRYLNAEDFPTPRKPWHAVFQRYQGKLLPDMYKIYGHKPGLCGRTHGKIGKTKTVKLKKTNLNIAKI